MCLVQTAPASTPEDAALVAVGHVRERAIVSEVTFVGDTMPVRESLVGSPVAGRVVEYLVNEGDFVETRTPLARLDASSLEIGLAAAQAEMEMLRHALEELQNGARPLEVERSRAAMTGAQTRAKFSKAQYERALSLADLGQIVTRDELDDAASQSRSAEQQFLAARAEYELLVEGPRPERISQAEARWRMQQERVRQQKQELAKHVISAPFAGYVSTEFTEVGHWIAQGGPVVEVVALDPLYVQIHVRNDYATHLRTGQEATVTLQALPGREFQAVVDVIAPKADTRSRSVPVKLRLENPREEDGRYLLRTGMLCEARLAVGSSRSAVMVPKDALVLGTGRPRVFILEEPASEGDTTVARAEMVELGQQHGTWIEVRGNLQPDDQVVLRGNERLISGNAVKVVDVLDP